MKHDRPDENGVVTVKGLLSDNTQAGTYLHQAACECCGSIRQWDLFWLPDEWRDRSVVVTARLATPEEL